jgi:hypothetical protein
MLEFLLVFFLQPGLGSVLQARCVTAAESPDVRVANVRALAPGPPPFLSFRYYEGKLHHRYSNSDLMLDDAGH